MQTLIITGGSKEERLTKTREKLAPPHPDFLEITSEKMIGVEEARRVRHFLTLKPYSAKIKVVLIREAERLTIPAQNALLKTLEEPPENCQIILETGNINTLLPTILSRCQIIKLRVARQLAGGLRVAKIQIRDRVGERLKMAGEYGKNKETAKEFVENLILSEREKLVKNNLAAAKNLALCLEALKYLAAN